MENNSNEIKSTIINIKDNNILLDENFQIKLIKLIIEDEKFSEQVLEILKPDYFDSILTKIILKYIFDYYSKYNLIPEYNTIINLINEKESDSVLKERLIDLLHILKDLNVTDKQFVKDISIDFCRKQSLKKGLLEAAESWEKGDYELIQKIITDSIKLGEIKDNGHNYIQDLEKRLVRQYRKPVPCLDLLDEQIGGGLSGGELGVVLSPTGGGKSMMLVKFASTALLLGKNVVYYSLELAERVIGNRFDACLNDIQLKNVLDNPDAIRERIEELKKMGGNLFIKEFPTGSATVNTVRNHIKLLERDGFRPDEIFVDYADIMKPTSTYAEKRHSLTQIYEALRALSMELDIPIWTASQAGRCLSLNTIVETPNGKIEIQNLKIGDKVLTHDGFKNVSYIFPIEKQATYKIKLKSGKEIYASARHKFPTTFNELKSIESGLNIGDKLLTKL